MPQLLPVNCRLVLGCLASLACAITGGCGPEPSQQTTEPVPAAETSAGGRVRADMEVLASDDMQGREAGTAGHRRAAEYVASRFAELGLVPSGDNGSYLQNIDFLETRLEPGSASMKLHRDDQVVTFEAGEDYVFSGGFGNATEAISAPLVFAGFGIRAPKYDHDDFAGVDVNGMILVEFTGAPATFTSDERAFYSSMREKQEVAAELGAVGILLIRTPVDLERMTWPRVVTASGSAGMRWLEADGTPHDGFIRLAGNAMLSETGAQKLFELAGRDLHALFEKHGNGMTGSFPLEVSATLRRESRQRRVSSPNVLALLPGRDRSLQGQHVLISSHLDHLGLQPGDGGDAIYNGAYDNAAGVATMLELAGELKREPHAPRRSVIFAAVTGEEKGLRGSDYLAYHPPVPVCSIVANINIDMPYLAYPIADIEGFGVEHSTLHGQLGRAAEKLGLVLTPDPRPELVRLIRSDQFSFVRHGVPGMNMQPGNASSDPAIDGSDMRAAFLRDHYHQPSDDLNLPFDEQGASRFAELAHDLVLLVANDDGRPQWHRGDFFGERFARECESEE